MQIKSILCAYSGDAAQGSGLRHAITLARHHGAHLTGVLRHGQSMLLDADRDGAKLIAMGAFEHSKSARDLFSGVTTDVMAKFHVPVFMAH